MKETPHDEEILEAVDLRKGNTTRSSPRRHGGPAWLLGALLSLWTIAVYVFFTRAPSAGGDAAALATPPDPPLEVPATPLPTPTPSPAPLPPSLRIESAPPGASVLRNGRFVGVTPLLLHDPRAGEALQITMVGHAPRMITLNPAETGQTLRLELERQYAVIRVRLEPPGARLWVNGDLVSLPDDGRLRLPQQEQVLRAEAEGYLPREVRVTPALAYEREVDLRLQPQTQTLP